MEGNLLKVLANDNILLLKGKQKKMGVPKFGELIRRRYPKCWFEDGKSKVFDPNGKLLGRKVDTLYIDGNSLLHPAMQYTFSYGDFQSGDLTNGSKTEEEMIQFGTDHFMNAIEALCLEFGPERLVLAIDGPAPLAKMIQQRQRRFGSKMDVGDNEVLKKSWTELINRAKSRSLDKEESFISLKIEYVQPTTTMKYGEVYISPHITAIESGSPQEEVYKSLMNGLIRWATDNKIRWYNLLHPETPLGFEYEGRWWYSVASCACAYAWRDIYNQSNLITLFCSNTRPPFDLSSKDNKYVYAGKPSATVEGIVNGVIQHYTKFKAREASFFVTHSSKIAEYCEKISEQIAETYPVYKQALLLTGIGTVLEQENRSKIEWLMRVRKRLITKLESQLNAANAPSASNVPNETLDIPDYEYGVTDVEGINYGSTFDSNSLTPGTSVMNLIDERIRERIRGNFITVKGGRRIKVVYSGHEEPGEGEHKIMNMIDYEDELPSDRISLVYGLDADLFMLTMVRNKGNLALVRENVFRKEKFKGSIGRLQPGYSSCHVVDINALKSLMDVHPLDFVFICFMFGNDFLRNVPSLVFDTTLRVQIDEDDSPYLFDYVLDVYLGVRRTVGQQNSLNPVFVNNYRSPIKINWSNFYVYLKELSRVEKQIFGGMIRKMRKEEEEELKMETVNKDYVPVRLRYAILRKCIRRRQEIYGPVVDQRARYVDDTNAFDYDLFKREWTQHLTFNIPGLETDGIGSSFTKNKADVVRNIAKEYMTGMEWAMMYYTNMHEIQNRQSILNMQWFYPYFQAPLIGQLADELFGFLQEDGERLFMEMKSKTGLENLLRGMFYYMDGSEITQEIKLRSNKLERDILDILPVDYFIRYPRLTSAISEQITEYISRTKIVKGNVDGNQYYYVGKNIAEKNNYRYTGYNTFSTEWSKPRRFDYKTVLSAPYTTNYKVQLLSVLPPQSSKYFPDGWSPSDNRISWMYPKTIPVDFNFRPRTHYAVLMIPPPMLTLVEHMVRERVYEQQMDNVRPGMFPTEVVRPDIGKNVIDSGLHYEDLRNVLDMELDISKGRFTWGLDLTYSSGLGAILLKDVAFKVTVLDSDRDRLDASVRNTQIFDNIEIMEYRHSTLPERPFEIFFLGRESEEEIQKLSLQYKAEEKVFVTIFDIPHPVIRDHEVRVVRKSGVAFIYVTRKVEQPRQREVAEERNEFVSTDKLLLRKIFDDQRFDKNIILTEEAKYSVSYKTDIKQIIERFGILGREIVDANANIGLSTYFLSQYYDKVMGIELDRDTFEVAKHNLEVLNATNVDLVNDDAVKFSENMEGGVIMFDPPWGGKDYVKKKSVDLYLSDINIKQIISRLTLNNNTVLLKAPLNFNEENFEFTDKMTVTRNGRASYLVYIVTPEL